MSERPEAYIERNSLVDLLREEGTGDPELFSEELREIIGKWKDQEYGRIPGNKKSIVAQIDHIIDEANLFSEAGYPMVAIDQLWDALYWAELENEVDFEERIKEKMLEIDPAINLPPKE